MHDVIVDALCHVQAKVHGQVHDTLHNVCLHEDLHGCMMLHDILYSISGAKCQIYDVMFELSEEEYCALNVNKF